MREIRLRMDNTICLTENIHSSAFQSKVPTKKATSEEIASLAILEVPYGILSYSYDRSVTLIKFRSISYPMTIENRNTLSERI